MKRRRGVSLVELLVVMSACTVILTTSAALIHRVMHAETRARAFQNVERTAWRLSAQFRRDVHQAQAASMLPDGANADEFLRLTLSDGQTIAYRHSDGVITRTLFEGERVISHEMFLFPPYVKVSVAEDGAPRRLALAVTADPVETPEVGNKQPWNQYATRVGFRVVGTIGRDLRLVQAASANEVQR